LNFPVDRDPAMPGRANIHNLNGTPRNGAAGSVGELGRVQPLYLQAILHGQRQVATGIAMETVRQGRSVPDVYADILQESMYEVGRLWETNRITVAQEHIATAITQYVIAQLYPLIQSAQPPRGRMVITGVEGEHHQVGPNMVADVLESAGWDVRFLGTDTPAAGVLQAVEMHRADVLASRPPCCSTFRTSDGSSRKRAPFPGGTCASSWVDALSAQLRSCIRNSAPTGSRWM